MPDLQFSVEGAEAVRHSAAPTIALRLRITNRNPDEQIQSLLLQCQVQIEAPRRRYEPAEQPRLLDLFSTPERWGQTVRSFLWLHLGVTVPAFSGSTVVDLALPCSYDFNVASTKYLAALEGGEVPLCLFFSGTIFYSDEERGLQIARVPWELEARYRLAIAVWREAIDQHFPNTAWLTLRRDVFEQLYEYKVRNGIPDWEEAIERLLAATEAEALS